MAAAPWLVLADTILQHEAVLARLGRGLPPADFAGLFVSDDDAERLLAELPGLAGAPAHDLDECRAALAPALAQARHDFASSLSGESPLARIVRAAALDANEAELLALVVAVDIDIRRQRLVGYIQDDITLPRLTLSTLAVPPNARVRRAALVEVDDEGPWGRRAVAPHPDVVWAVLGHEPDGLDVAMGPGSGAATVVLVNGGDAVARERAALAATPARTVLRASVPVDDADWASLVRRATLHAEGVVLAVADELSPSASRWIERADHLCWLVSSRHELPLDHLPRRPWAEVRADDAPAAADEWRDALGIDPPPGHLLGPAQLALVATAYDGGDVRDAVRRLSGGHLDRLARRVRPSRGWGDVVLPADQSARLHELATRFRHRRHVHDDWGFRPGSARGLVALFAGPSGTGKTLAAEVVAGELGLDLSQVNLASLVSKYIGETEKNLEAVFDAACHGSLALFFDEADAVFGKRSEVSDAHDRYANVEVAYLLQRLERHDGLVVLATNLQRNIDTAFLRRVHVAVDFAEPDEEQRLAIWSLSFPPGAPVDGLDLAFLARRFKLTGGAIANVALHSAFLAAEAGTPITMPLVVSALRRELQKLGRLCSPDDFGAYAELVG